jgi:hypothetical protein
MAKALVSFMSKRIWFKYLLTRIGSYLSPGAIYGLNAVNNYLAVGRWMRGQGYDVTHRLDRREQLYELVGTQVGDRRVLYLEFGVAQGHATRYWCKLLHNPQSKLHGFDSFEGLPEDWLPQSPKGAFATGGQIPRIEDVRVEFFKGWFEDTLPHYQCPQHEVLVLNMDADLYSPTRFVLDMLENQIVPGTYIYFDEFNHQFHEMRAFDEFLRRTGMKFSLVGVTRALKHVLFQRTR